LTSLQNEYTNHLSRLQQTNEFLVEESHQKQVQITTLQEQFHYASSIYTTAAPVEIRTISFLNSQNDNILQPKKTNEKLRLEVEQETSHISSHQAEIENLKNKLRIVKSLNQQKNVEIASLRDVIENANKTAVSTHRVKNKFPPFTEIIERQKKEIAMLKEENSQRKKLADTMNEKINTLEREKEKQMLKIENLENTLKEVEENREAGLKDEAEKEKQNSVYAFCHPSFSKQLNNTIQSINLNSQFQDNKVREIMPLVNEEYSKKILSLSEESAECSKENQRIIENFRIFLSDLSYILQIPVSI
jgi:chromosome segregation ATPase